MTARVADPLPECELCEVPTAREAWERNGKLCTRCSDGVADTVRMLLPGIGRAGSEDSRRRQLEALNAAPVDQTVFTEGWRPPVPVPGQLALPDEELGRC